MSERDNRVKAFEKLMRSGLSSTDVFCLKNQLMAMGFFTAPASTKYHGNYEGGLFDHNSTNELEIICEVGEGVYQKHFVYLNDYTLYVVEDISGSGVDKYHYEINFLPQYGFTITHND